MENSDLMVKDLINEVRGTWRSAIHEGDVLALKAALQWLKDLDIEDIIVESDCLQVVNGVSCKCPDISKYGAILANCWNDLLNFKVCFVRRQTKFLPNCIADYVLKEII
ncbi:hypothetical protein JHK82_048150 [Glycine max]|uniref:RNase H type-1 domain-containing protein n=2 Tax=Glycine subgen. Soja TaxID=1462606 RepID=A0A0R0FFA1_SOYBN|nr:hypothetical protein JHK86_048028 [Glycine max]KAG4933818.1 hypothetical protein JHK87_047820 [Glycine soja]KAG4943996.1 hypothetical protein JHK85_048642 [Glycine max]KAG5098296.1 hypothetical protein JHK82_048150 [Glycine max]KAG5103086.1 hypothetical protein JHK84_048055 [Glycine max]